MKIAVLKELKTDETRVALRPDQAAALCRAGHSVFVETGAGVEAGFRDVDYAAGGALVCEKRRAVGEGELVLKVKAPASDEYDDYGPDKVLFTYLHLDENIGPDDIRRFIASGVMGIAYEWVGRDGDHPLLTPMSRLTGYLFAQRATEICARRKGVFLPRNEKFMPGGRVLIIGTGNIGLSAIKYFLDMGSRLAVLCKDDAEALNRKLNARFETGDVDYVTERNLRLVRMRDGEPEATRREVAEMMGALDIVINCAVRRPDLPKRRLPYLISRDMIARMQPGSVVCDATACDGDLIETCVSSPLLDRVDVHDGVYHYNCDHIPSLVARTAVELLTDATFPFVEEIAAKGVDRAIAEDDRLANGVVCFRNQITHRYTAEKKGFPYRPIDDLLREARR